MTVLPPKLITFLGKLFYMIFFLQGLCVDDAQGQGGLGVQLLEGVQHPQINIRPRAALKKSGKPGFGVKSDV